MGCCVGLSQPRSHPTSINNLNPINRPQHQPQHQLKHPNPIDRIQSQSLSPEGYLGELETWDRAEAALTDALNSTGLPWAVNEADGAFYGPKIDITVFDALRRKFQCATVQLDFQMPIR